MHACADWGRHEAEHKPTPAEQMLLCPTTLTGVAARRLFKRIVPSSYLHSSCGALLHARFAASHNRGAAQHILNSAIQEAVGLICPH
eukprot:6211198-Pleurochrysis_carterae.AAC.6